MTIILYLLVVSLALGAGGLGFFLWSLRSGQYDDLDGAANRILFDEDTVAPLPPPPLPPLGAGQSRVLK
jgi:cbb3-type cytochrome oxidase maturation protein